MTARREKGRADIEKNGIEIVQLVREFDKAIRMYNN